MWKAPFHVNRRLVVLFALVVWYTFMGCCHVGFGDEGKTSKMTTTGRNSLKIVVCSTLFRTLAVDHGPPSKRCSHVSVPFSFLWPLGGLALEDSTPSRRLDHGQHVRLHHVALQQACSKSADCGAFSWSSGTHRRDWSVLLVIQKQITVGDMLKTSEIRRKALKCTKVRHKLDNYTTLHTDWWVWAYTYMQLWISRSLPHTRKWVCSNQKSNHKCFCYVILHLAPRKKVC